MHNLDEIAIKAREELESAQELSQIQEIKVKYLGRKGVLTALLRDVSHLSVQERPVFGKQCNDLKDELSAYANTMISKLQESQQKATIVKGAIDVTLPGRAVMAGRLHPITQITSDICAIFSSMGFTIATGPEVEFDYYNFEALNIPKDHPARDMQDTFYIDEEVVLRTHTSPVQIRVMEKYSPPLRVISPGRVYRPDLDISHSPMFHQVEGFMVDKNITFGDLKGMLSFFLREMFGKDTRLRFRPSFFPFTEPSAEVDICCILCKGDGCRLCSQSGWLEILGSGMIDPAVFANVGYDTKQFSGFAFGLGVERIAMLKYSVSDIRLFYENDIRFLEQF